MTAASSRLRVTFGVANACVALVWLGGVFGALQTRFWALDVPVALVSLVQLLSAISLLANWRWALHALRVAAWLNLVTGLSVVAVIVISMTFLRSIHGDYAIAGMAVSGLIVALLVPYTLLLPALQLLWLKRAQAEASS